MSFSFDASKTQSGLTMPTSMPTSMPATTAAMPFSFEVPGGGDAAKPIPAAYPAMVNSPYAKPIQSTQSLPTGVSGTTQPTGFSFGAPATSTPSTGMVLGSLTTPAQTSGLTFGATPTPSTGIGFGTTTAAPATGFSTSLGNTTGFSLGSTTVTTTAPATTGWSFETPKSVPGTAFALGGGETAPTQTAPTLNFGTPSAMASGFHRGSTTGVPAATTTTATPVTSFNLGSGTTTTTTTATTSGPGLTLDATKTTAAQPGMDVGFSFGAGSTAAATTTVFGLNKSAAVTAPSSSLPSTTTPSLGTTTTVTSSTSAGQIGAINFCQLEESINKWTLELEEQEKVFVNQATQINAWDKLLIANGEKIVTLNQEVERVKIEQQQLEHELDYVVGQQKELQDCLEPLEKELVSLSVSDPEREYTYRLAENLDTQLKQMSEDLKEIIEHLNEANRTQDSSDPIVQIGKILNAHMNSLQWLDQRTALLSQKIQQIDQMHQNFRQENERSFSLAYNFSFRHLPL